MILQKLVYRADSEQDSVLIRVGDLQHRVGYRIGFRLDHYLRLAAKQAARFDRAPASFWRDVELPSLDEEVTVSRIPRESTQTPTYKRWEVGGQGTLVRLTFDNVDAMFPYEDAVKLGHAIRRAARRAKAWAGDDSTYSAMLGMLTDAEEDYKLGIERCG